MALTVDTFVSFLHPTLQNAIIEVNTQEDEDPPIITDIGLVINAVEKANKRYNKLTANMPKKANVRFDSETFQVKVALCDVYEYVLHDHALLHALSLQTMSLSENQVFDNYFRLLQAERDEIADMEKKLLDEIKDKEDDAENMGVLLYHRFPQQSSSNPFSRRWR